MHTMRRSYRTNPTKLKDAEQQLSLIIDKAKYSYELSLIQNFSLTKSARIYSYISSIKSSDQIPSFIYLENITASSNEDEANLFNNYFFSVFTNSSYQLPSIHEEAHAIPSLHKINIQVDQVYEALVSLDTSKAAGIDTINPAVLKYCAIPLTRPLFHLFNFSLLTCNLPSEWRIHCMARVFKSGDRANVGNYTETNLTIMCSF